jgi:hypothetical protein
MLHIRTSNKYTCNTKNRHQMVEIIGCHIFEHQMVHITTSLIWNMPLNSLNKPHVHMYMDDMVKHFNIQVMS